MNSRPSVTWATILLEQFGIAFVYFVLARIGQILAIDPGNVTPIWPASGFALVAVLCRGYRIWPGLWLGNFLGNTWAFLDMSTPADALRTLASGIAIGPGDATQACLGAYLMRRCCTCEEPLARVRDVFCFVGMQAIACLFSATFGVLALCVGRISPWKSFGYTWLTWYLGDGVGIILFAPFLLTIREAWPLLRTPKRLTEAASIFLLSAAVAGLVFNDMFQQSLSFLPLPFVLWAAVRGDRFAVAANVLVIFAVAVGGTAHGRGPFATGDTNIALLVLQLYAATTAVTGLAVSAALCERARAEQALRKTGSRLDQALRSGNIGLWDWDVLANYVYFSPQFKIQLGHDPDAPWSTYQEWESRLHPDDKQAAVQRVHDYLNGHSPDYVSTFRMRRKDGTYVWILSQGEAERDDRNKMLRMIGVHVDVTESRLREEELERMNLELKQMAHAASHDLQEPLRSITSFSQLVDRKYRDRLDGDGRSWLDAIVGGTRRMKELIQDLRAYTQVDSPVHAFESIDLERVLGDALANLASSIRDSGAEVTHEPLPVIHGNGSQFVQLFQNLIGNAIKFRSSQSPRIHVSTERSGGTWIVSVRDNGMGIDAKYHRAIFDVFRRLHHRHEQPGTGIGLAICRRVVQLHHGEIWVDSVPGEGSTFRFTVPIGPREVKP